MGWPVEGRMQVDPARPALVFVDLVFARLDREPHGFRRVRERRRVEMPLDGAVLGGREEHPPLLFVHAGDRIDVPVARRHLRESRSARGIQEIDVPVATAIAQPEQARRLLEHVCLRKLDVGRRRFGREHARRPAACVGANELEPLLIARQRLEEQRASVGAPRETRNVPLFFAAGRKIDEGRTARRKLDHPHANDGVLSPGGGIPLHHDVGPLLAVADHRESARRPARRLRDKQCDRTSATTNTRWSPRIPPDR